MVLLIGNYSPDQQQSMQRFAELMLQGLTTAGVAAEMISPQPKLIRLFPSGAVAKWLGYIDKYLLFPFSLRRKLAARPDLVHICDHSNAVYVSGCAGTPVLVTCHDLLAVRGGFGEDTDCPASFTGRLLQRWILRGLKKADVVVCDSRATAEDAARLVSEGEPDPKLEVVMLSLNYNYRKLTDDVVIPRLKSIAGFDVDLPFALHVGSNLRRKNRDGVLRIFARCKDQWNGKMVFAGDRLNEELLELARNLQISDRVVQVVGPTCETLEALYNRATALIYPSRFEGYGWPIIEAQACGCPVVCSDAGPMPEAAGDAGLFHDPADEEGFARDLLRLTNSAERASWGENGLRNVQRFSTPRMIAQYLKVYRQLAPKL